MESVVCNPLAQRKKDQNSLIFSIFFAMLEKAKKDYAHINHFQ